MVVYSGYFSVVAFVCFPSLGYVGGDYYIPVFLLVQLSSLGWGFPSHSFCKAGFVDTYCLNLFCHGISCFLY